VKVVGADKSASAASGAKAVSEIGLRNRVTSNDLSWEFGGRQQRGWTIYAPLVCETIGVDSDIDTEAFARALATWQESRGVPSSGVMDGETWTRMVSELQADRIKAHAQATSDSLAQVPASEFFDPERPVELRQVERSAYEAYKRMVADAIKDPSLGLTTNSDGTLALSERFLKIISAFRSREYQDQLRKASPKSGRAGLAVNSPHFTGRALDLYVGGDPVDTKDTNRLIQTRTPVYRWLVKNTSKYGFRPYFYEPWHWEYVR